MPKQNNHDMVYCHCSAIFSSKHGKKHLLTKRHREMLKEYMLVSNEEREKHANLMKCMNIPLLVIPSDDEIEFSLFSYI